MLFGFGVILYYRLILLFLDRSSSYYSRTESHEQEQVRCNDRCEQTEYRLGAVRYDNKCCDERTLGFFKPPDTLHNNSDKHRHIGDESECAYRDKICQEFVMGAVEYAAMTLQHIFSVYFLDHLSEGVGTGAYKHILDTV